MRDARGVRAAPRARGRRRAGRARRADAARARRRRHVPRQSRRAWSSSPATRGIDAHGRRRQELPFADGVVRHRGRRVDALPRARLDRRSPRWRVSSRPAARCRRHELGRSHRGAPAAVRQITRIRSRRSTRENGEEHLRRHFATVERIDADGRGTGARPATSSSRTAARSPGRPRSCRTTSRCRFVVHGRTDDLRGDDDDPPGRADPAQARRRGAVATTSSPSSSSATRAATCPTTRWPRSAWRCSSAGSRRGDVRADRRDDPQRRDDRPRRRARAQGRRQALDRRCRRQDVALGRADRRGVRRSASGR